MRAAEIMTRSVITVRSDDSVRRAIELLTEHGVASLPVLDGDDRVVGIVGEVDLIRNRMPPDPRSHLRTEVYEQHDPAGLVRDVMTETAVCLGEGADIADVAALMLNVNVRAVPIVAGARLVGIVSRRDLLRTLLRGDSVIEAEVIQRLKEYADDADRWHVAVKDGVVTVRGHFESAAQQEIVTVLARTVGGVVRVHTHRRRLT